MREGIGSIALYNIIIIFIAVTFAVLAGTLSYSKAFKMNNRIINAIEKYEGYNDLSADKITTDLMSIGYKQDSGISCPIRDGLEALEPISTNSNFHFCVYKYPENTREWNGRYSTYGVVTYINIDLPIVGDFIKIPVFGRSKMIFSFSEINEPAPSLVRNLTVNIADDVEPLYLTSDGNSLEFIQGTTVDINNLINVRLKASNGVIVNLNSTEYSISGFDTSTIGEHTLEISYMGLVTEMKYFVVASKSA